MAGSIPPLVSSTPPPLSAFDDDEEEDEDEFGMYAVAEDIDYNECISFKEKNEVKQDGGKSRGEQDSTSQDSTTDSGLCPDSEGMSPTPHSDEERTVKQSANSVCERLFQQPTHLPKLGSRLSPTCETEGLDSSSEFSVHSDLPNGHVTAEDPEDDFGNFENFESADSSEQSVPPDENLEVTVVKSLETEKVIQNSSSETEDVRGDEGTNCILESEYSQYGEPSEHNSCESEDKEFDEHKEISTVNITSIDIETKTIDSINISALEKTDTSDNVEVYEQQFSLEEFTASNAISLQAEQNSEINSANDKFEEQDVEFDDFTDFKADFSNFYSPNIEQCDLVSEHSKPNVEQNHSEEVVKSVCAPNDASDEEFSDFTEFSSSDCAFVTAQKSSSVENVSRIPNVSSDDSDLRTDSEFQDWVSVFPSCSSSDPAPVEEGQAVILRKNDPVWSRLIPLETSPALSYQWAESLANRRLLTALNIDSRNILMMPWMPRFAANLSCGPLQPVKALEPLQPTPAPISAPVHTSTGQESVPDAHFDWVGSGLINPLDSSHSSLLDLNFMMTLASHLTISPKQIKLQKTLGIEAQTILSSLPDLSFMRKTYIDFPINEG